MIKQTAFDAVAVDYDSMFTHSLIGWQQRMLVREHLHSFLAGHANLHILEINCGTGEDACWLASLGHKVIATDASALMIERAKQKGATSRGKKPIFIQCDFEELASKLETQKFDLIFSNFSGLNCIEPEKVQELSGQLAHLLNSNGQFIAVIFGKYTVWEISYFLFKFNLKRAFARWKKMPVPVALQKGIDQPVYYYSIKEFSGLMKPFKLLQKFPVGLCIPPSYLEQSMHKNTRLFQLLTNMEKRTMHFSFLSHFADHTFLRFKKKPV